MLPLKSEVRECVRSHPGITAGDIAGVAVVLDIDALDEVLHVIQRRPRTLYETQHSHLEYVNLGRELGRVRNNGHPSVHDIEMV